MEKYSIPKGTRDFTPEVLTKRQFILDTIKTVFQKYNFRQLETPAIENLSTLMGKYGDEGDQLVFKILNSGDYLNGVDFSTAGEKSAKKLTTAISNKGLRYDLTVPLARYVAMHRHDIAFPFRRFQMQPVWRADRPQKGRYREFFQCDADVVGTKSLLCEAEMIAIIQEVFNNLGLQHYRIRVNHRGILSGLAQCIKMENEGLFFSILDKWDKIGAAAVQKELLDKGVRKNSLNDIFDLFSLIGTNAEKIETLAARLGHIEEVKKGLADIEEIIRFLSKLGISESTFELDITLARGLSYYTGTLFEVVLDDVAIGSVSGGGRYDNLTEIFGLPNVSGVGFSLGVDRLYDALEVLNIFPSKINKPPTLLITHFDIESMHYGLGVLAKIRQKGYCAELYPDNSKLKKQLDYAHKTKIPFVVIIGEEEMQKQCLTLKNMNTGEQQKLTTEEIINVIAK